MWKAKISERTGTKQDNYELIILRIEYFAHSTSFAAREMSGMHTGVRAVASERVLKPHN